MQLSTYTQRTAVRTVVGVQSGGYSVMGAHTLPEGKLGHASGIGGASPEMSAGSEEEGVSLYLIIQGLVLI